MYLFTLVFIFLTIIGIFTEVLTMQNNRVSAREITGASSMLTWHGAAIVAARWSVGGAPSFPSWGVPATPCTLIAAGQAAPPLLPAPECPDNDGVLGTNAQLNNLRVAPAITVTTLLPTQYVARYNSIMFTANNVRLAVTFINPNPADANAPLPPTGLTGSQLYRQLRRLNVDPSIYGYVAGSVLQPAAAPDPATPGSGAYTIPAALVFDAIVNPAGPIMNGAIAVFTPL